MEEQKVEPQAALPQDTQQRLLEQDAPEDEEEHNNPLELDDDSDDSSDDSVEYTTTDKGNAVAYQETDLAAQQISQEYETSRQGSVIQPSPINPAKKIIQVLEEASEGVQILADTQEKGIAFESSESYQSLLDKSAQRTTQN